MKCINRWRAESSFAGLHPRWSGALLRSLHILSYYFSSHDNRIRRRRVSNRKVIATVWGGGGIGDEKESLVRVAQIGLFYVEMYNESWQQPGLRILLLKKFFKFFISYSVHAFLQTKMFSSFLRLNIQITPSLATYTQFRPFSWHESKFHQTESSILRHSYDSPILSW